MPKRNKSYTVQVYSILSNKLSRFQIFRTLHVYNFRALHFGWKKCNNILYKSNYVNYIVIPSFLELCFIYIYIKIHSEYISQLYLSNSLNQNVGIIIIVFNCKIFRPGHLTWSHHIKNKRLSLNNCLSMLEILINNKYTKLTSYVYIFNQANVDFWFIILVKMRLKYQQNSIFPNRSS